MFPSPSQLVLRGEKRGEEIEGFFWRGDQIYGKLPLQFCTSELKVLYSKELLHHPCLLTNRDSPLGQVFLSPWKITFTIASYYASKAQDRLKPPNRLCTFVAAISRMFGRKCMSAKVSKGSGFRDNKPLSCDSFIWVTRPPAKQMQCLLLPLLSRDFRNNF